mmetsp:Transcript_45335/g.135264  ORF Transcript_45335/g.135264 Transcript_45335/m.135264 type:complete len:308 (-) Transcript_45335:1147-2070(-)
MQSYNPDVRLCQHLLAYLHGHNLATFLCYHCNKPTRHHLRCNVNQFQEGHWERQGKLSRRNTTLQRGTGAPLEPPLRRCHNFYPSHFVEHHTWHLPHGTRHAAPIADRSATVALGSSHEPSLNTTTPMTVAAMHAAAAASRCTAARISPYGAVPSCSSLGLSPYRNGTSFDSTVPSTTWDSNCRKSGSSGPLRLKKLNALRSISYKPCASARRISSYVLGTALRSPAAARSACPSTFALSRLLLAPWPNTGVTACAASPSNTTDGADRREHRTRFPAELGCRVHTCSAIAGTHAGGMPAKRVVRRCS